MHSPYRELAEVAAYPKLNPPLIEAPPYGRTYGCRCCSFGEQTNLYNHQPGIAWYAWCVNCLRHYSKVLTKLDFYPGLRSGLDLGEITGPPSRMVWFKDEEDIAVLQHVIQHYHIPLIRYPIYINRAQQWQPAPSHMKTSHSKVSSIITKLKRMLGLR